MSFSFSYFVFFASKHHHHLVHLLSGHQQQTISLLIMLVVLSQDKVLWFHFELLFYCFHFMVFITLSLFTDQILSKKFLLLNYFFNIYIYIFSNRTCWLSEFYHYFSLTLDGLQGCVVSIIFCFANHEVIHHLNLKLNTNLLNSLNFSDSLSSHSDI